MYDHSSILICFILFIAMIAGLEFGFRGGRLWQQQVNDGQKSQLGAVQGSLLGLLALLLGFTFSLALQRFDDRSKAVIDEANAIGTAVLRTRLLDASVRSDANASLRDYLDLRVRSAAVSLDQRDERGAMLAEAQNIQSELWQQIERAVVADDRTVTTGFYIQAVNEMFDAYGRRDAALARHVPEAVLFLLFLTFVMVCLIVGITSGASGARPPASMLMMVVLIILLVFIIIDLDRPRRGMIEIDHSSLSDLQQSLAARPAP